MSSLSLALAFALALSLALARSRSRSRSLSLSLSLSRSRSLSGCGQVSVLSQALASGPCRFKLEFKVRNAEELQPIAEQLKKEDSKTTLTHSVNR